MSIVPVERPHKPAWLTPALLGFVALCVGAPLAGAQEQPDESWLPALPGEVDSGGTLTFINTSGRSIDVAAQPFGEIAALGAAIGDAGPLLLRPGGARRIAWVVTEVPDVPPEDPPPASGLLVQHLPGVRTFVRIEQGGGIAATHARSRSRATSRFAIPWQEPAGQDPVTVRVGVSNPGFEEADATITIRDAAGNVEGSETLLIPPLFASAMVFDLGAGGRAAGPRSIDVDASDPVVTDAILATPEGLTFLPAARDVAESGQFWFPYVNDLGLETLFANLPGGAAYGGEVRFFDPKGNLIEGVGTFTAGAGALASVPAFNGGSAPVLGAICVDVTSGTTPRAPSITLRSSGDLTVADPMRRIRPGQRGVAPVPTDAPEVLANSVILVNNPTATPAFGTVRARDGAGRVLVEKRLKVKPFHNLSVPLAKLLRKAPGAFYVEIVNPPLAGATAKGGGDFQGAVVLSSAVVAHKRKAGNGDGSRLAVHPLLAGDDPGVPVIVAPEVVKPDVDKKAFLTFDGRAAGIGKNARLRIVGSLPPLEWRVRGKKTIKLKLKSKSLGTKQTLLSHWPLGEPLTVVLVDDATNQASQEVTIVRGTPPEPEE